MKTSNPDDLDDILKALSTDNIETPETHSMLTVVEPINEEDEMAKTLTGLDDLIKSNAQMLEEAKQMVFSTGDADMFESYSNISKSQSEAFKNKVKLLVEKQKNTIMQKTKDREINLKEKLAEHTMGKDSEKPATSQTLNQTNVLVTATREELFDMLTKRKELDAVTIEVPSSERSG
jgi:hypothetical protein